MSKIVSQSGSSPISIATAKEWLKVDNSDEDDIIQIMLDSALSICEEYTFRKFPLSIIEDSFKSWSMYFNLSFPANSITSITYYDSNNDAQTMVVSDFYELVEGEPEPNRLHRIQGNVLPSLSTDKQFPILIRYETGYTDGNVPKALISAMLLTLTKLYENREDEFIDSNKIRRASEYIMNVYRLKSF